MPFCIGWVQDFAEIALSCMVKEIEANLCLSIFGKNSKIAKSTLIRYPVGKKKSLYFARLRR